MAAVSVSMFMSCLGVINGTLTAGDVIFLQTIMAMSYGPLFNLGNMYIRFQESIVELRDVAALLSLEREIVEPQNPIELPQEKSLPIHIRDLTYHYGDRCVEYCVKLAVQELQLEYRTRHNFTDHRKVRNRQIHSPQLAPEILGS